MFVGRMVKCIIHSAGVSVQEKLHAGCRSAMLGRAKPLRRTQFLEKKHLQVFNRTGKAMKKLQWIPNTIMMASKLFFLLMDWETITFVRKGQRYKKSSSNTHDSTFDENIYQSKLKAVNYSRKMINLRCLAGSRTCLCWLIQCSF